MSCDIERFQERIGRVEELIEEDDLISLAELLTDLKLSLEMIQSFSFFQKQKQRLDRFEGSILEYTRIKEDQVFHKVKYNNSNNAVVKTISKENIDETAQ